MSLVTVESQQVENISILVPNFYELSSSMANITAISIFDWLVNFLYSHPAVFLSSRLIAQVSFLVFPGDHIVVHFTVLLHMKHMLQIPLNYPTPISIFLFFTFVPLM